MAREISPRASRRMPSTLPARARPAARSASSVIGWEPSTATYFYEKPCDILPLLRLTADEALALALAGQTFAAWRGSPLGRALTEALHKIAGVVGGAVSLPANEISNLIFQPEDPLEGEAESRFFAITLEAVRRHRELEIAYCKPGSQRPTARLVHPLHLAFLDHRWVLIAQDQERDDIRTFVLARMESVRPTGRRFPPPDFDARKYLSGSFGLFSGRQEFDVRVWFDTFAAPFIRERHWHHSQEIVAGRDGGIEVRLRLNNLIDVQRWLLAWGSHAEALAPAELREAVAHEVAALARRYKVHAGIPLPPGQPLSQPVG